MSKEMKSNELKQIFINSSRWKNEATWYEGKRLLFESEFEIWKMGRTELLKEVKKVVDEIHTHWKCGGETRLRNWTEIKEELKQKLSDLAGGKN